MAAPALPGESSCEAPKDLLSGSWKAAGRRCGRMGVGRARRATVGPASLFKMTREPANMADSDSMTRPVDRIRLSAGSGRFLACPGPDQIRPRAHETGRRPILRCESARELYADNFDRRFVPARLRSRSFVASMLCRNAIPGLGPIAARTDDTRVLSCVPATLAPTRNVLSIIAAISAWSRHVVVSVQLGHWSLAPPGEPPSVPTSISQQILRYPFPHRNRPTLDPEGREHFPLRSTIPTKPIGVACRRRTLIQVSNARSQPPGVCRMCPFFVLLLTAPTTQTACVPPLRPVS